MSCLDFLILIFPVGCVDVHACGRRITAIMAAFQAADAGSTPAARTKLKVKASLRSATYLSYRRDLARNMLKKV